jgi:hypothetical protein
MNDAPRNPHCRELAALLVAATDDEQAERLIGAHIAGCSDCAAAESALAALVAGYRAAEQPPLMSGVERRLLAQLCEDQHR